jgi:hypothetical protein
MERQRMEVPIQILPQQPRHTTQIIREYLPHPSAPPPPTPDQTATIQALNVQLANAEGAAAAHARQGTELRSMFDKISRHWTPTTLDTIGQSSSGSGYPPGSFAHAKAPPKAPSAAPYTLARPTAAPKKTPSAAPARPTAAPKAPSAAPFGTTFVPPSPRPERAAKTGTKQKREENPLRKPNITQTRRMQPNPATEGRTKGQKRKREDDDQGGPPVRRTRINTEPIPTPPPPPGPNARTTRRRGNRRGQAFTVTDA